MKAPPRRAGTCQVMIPRGAPVRRCRAHVMEGANVCYAHRRLSLAVDRALAARQLARCT